MTRPHFVLPPELDPPLHWVDLIRVARLSDFELRTASPPLSPFSSRALDSLLALASYYSNPSLVRSTLSCGANPNSHLHTRTHDFGLGHTDQIEDFLFMTPLMLSVAKTSSPAGAECLSLLLDAGADPLASAPDGWTAFHYAAIHASDPDSIPALLGTNPPSSLEALNMDGQTPLRLAVLHNSPEQASLLFRLGARTPSPEILFTVFLDSRSFETPDEEQWARFFLDIGLPLSEPLAASGLLPEEALRQNLRNKTADVFRAAREAEELRDAVSHSGKSFPRSRI